MKVGTFPFFALFGLLTVVHSAPSNSFQEEVYREAVTDGYVIDNVYLDWFTTESPKTAPTSQQPSPEEDVSEASGDTSDEDETFGVFQHGGAATTATPKAWSPEQPLLESNGSELLEGSGDATDVFIFFQNGSKHDVSTTVNVSTDWSTDQSNETDLLEGSGDVFDVSIFFQNGSKYDVSTTESVSPDWSADPTSIDYSDPDLLYDFSEGPGDVSNTSVVLQHGGEHDVATTTSVSPDWSADHVPTEILEYDYDYLEGPRDVSNTSFVLQHGGEHDVATTTSVSPDWSADQSNESDLLEESGDVSDVSSFLQQGRKHDVSTTTSVVAAWSTQQPSTESTESDSLTGSGDATDLHIFSQLEPQPDESTTAGAAHTRSPSTAALPGDADGSGSGDVWPSDAEIIHSTTSSSVGVSYTDTSTTSPISTPILRRNFHPIQRHNVVNVGASNLQSEPQKKDSSLPSNNGARTPGWIIILAFIVGIAALIMVCIAIATRDKWNAPNKAPSPDSESKMKPINQQRAVEMETFLQKEQPRENGRVTEYTVIPLDELPEKYSSD